MVNAFENRTNKYSNMTCQMMQKNVSQLAKSGIRAQPIKNPDEHEKINCTTGTISHSQTPLHKNNISDGKSTIQIKDGWRKSDCIV